MLWALLLTGCKSPCEKVIDYLVDECKIVAASGDEPAAECKKDTIAACEAECTLAADCSIHIPPTQMTGDEFTAFLQAVEVYEGCLAGCQPADTEPEDTGPTFTF